MEDAPTPMVSESTVRNQLVAERDSNAIQIKHTKAAAENFKFLLAEKEKTLTNLNFGIQLVKQSFRPTDEKIQATRKSVREKRAGELDLLRLKIKESEEREKHFSKLISDYKANIDENNANLTAHRKSMASECDSLERRYHFEVENAQASLKELSKVHKQALADFVKLRDEKKFQLDKMDVLKQELFVMRTQFEKVSVEKKTLNKQSKELEARALQLDELVKQERDSPTLLKIEDNKRNLQMRAKQISDANTLRIQKQQSLDTQKTKISNLVQERDLLTEERKSLEKSFANKMDELDIIAAEMVRTQAELEDTRKRTEQFEKEMHRKLEELRRRSESYGAELQRQMDGVRRESVIFTQQMERKKHAERKQRERTKEELRQELQSLDQMMEVLKQGHQLEMDSKLRHYQRKERDLEVFGEGEKEGNEFETNLIKSNIEKLGVKRNAAQANFEQQQAKMKEDIEWLRRKMDNVKKAADASKAIEENNRRVEVSRDLVRNMERQINAKKAKHMQMHRDAYDLKNSMEQKGMQSEFDPEAIDVTGMQSRNQQMALKQAQDSFEHWMPKLDCPVRKVQVQRGNGQVLEQISLTGAAAKFTSQTLSKVATDSNPADYRVETQQMEMTRPGVDCTTKFRKVVYSGKGIDMDVMNEAKRILVIHQEGVTKEADETEEEFKLRKVLVKRAADLQKMMDNSELVQNSSMPSGKVPKEKPAEEELTRAQAVFSQITQLMSHNQRPVVSDLNQTLSQLEADLRQDGHKIFNMKNGAQNANVRKHGAGKK